jgi:outer membrane protein assembly factor BamB
MPDPHSASPTVPEDVAQEMLDRVASSSGSHFRWEWGMGILAVGSLAEAAVWTTFALDATYQVIWSLGVVSGTVFALLLWWIFGSGISWSSRFFGLLGLAVTAGAFLGAFRFEGFEGDMWPRFRFRFEPTAEERLQEFLAADETTPTSTATAGEGESVATSVGFQVTETDWPGFRGPLRNGITSVKAGEFDWTKKPTELWRHPVGRGWSSFSVVQGRAFTQEQRDDLECVVCYDIKTGQQIWAHEDDERFDEPLGGPGPRATPTIHESRLYSLGATGLLNCLDAVNGELLWQKNILREVDAKNIEWAMAGSPLIVGDHVIVIPGGNNGNSVIAYDRTSGEKIWSSGNDKASYAAPTLRTLLGTEQVVVFDGEGVKGYSPDAGTQLWNVAWTNGPKVNAAEPIPISDSLLFIGSGYGQGSGLIELSLEGGVWKTKTLWTSRRFKLKFNAAVRQDEHAFGLDEGILACLNMRTGEQIWKRGRYGYGQILLAGDAIVVQAENGDVAFVKATTERFTELLRFPALDGKTWNHPVIWHDLLLVRNGEEAICYRLTKR